MGLKPDRWIRKMCLEQKMIEPYEEKQVRQGVISYGVSSYGYDIRVADEFKIFTPNPYNTVVDPKHLDERSLIPFKGDVCIIPPNSFALAVTVDLQIPRSVFTLAVGKSTYARCGILTNVTPFEPGWEGYATLEISNTTPLPAKIYSGEGIAQVLFFEADEPCETSYADRKGKYQGQTGIVLPRL